MNILFYDPDNGLEIKTVGKLSDKASKYVFFDEVREAYLLGKSVIIYQHSNRTASEDQKVLRIQQLKDCLSLSTNQIEVLPWGGRNFYLVKQPHHAETIEKNIKDVQKYFIRSLYR